MAQTMDTARWLVQVRWFAAVVLAISLFAFTKTTHVLPHEVWRPLGIAVAALGVFNGLTLLALNRGWPLGHSLTAQMLMDLVFLTVLLHYSGGIENPLWLLAIFHAILGGIVLGRKQSFVLAAVSLALFACLAWLEWSKTIQHFTVALFPHHLGSGSEVEHAVFHAPYVLSRVGLFGIVVFATTYFVTTLAERARQGERIFEEMVIRAHSERQLLEKALDATGTGLRLVAANLSTEWSNQRWDEWFSGTEETLESQPMDDADALRETTIDGITRVTERSGHGKDTAPTEKRIYRVTTAALRDADGKMVKFVELAQDITDSKRLQSQLIEAGKLAAAGELAGNIAHEINNPVGIISGKARLLLSDRLGEMTEPVASELKKIIEAADRVARIAQGLLSYCRPSGATRTSFDIQIALRRAWSLVDHRASRCGVVLRMESPDDLPPIHANLGEMEQVFLNLFLNALDAMPNGGELLVDGHVVPAESAPEQLDTLALVIQDTGRGILPKVAPRMFEPFVTTKPDGKGTGLGLSICAGILRSHGGSITVGNVPEGGARFVLYLPLAHTSSRGIA